MQIRRQPAVAAGFQEVGACGDRHDSARDEVGEVLAIDAGGERNRKLGSHRLAKFVGQRERDDVQRRAGEVHDLFGRLEEVAVVFDFQRVGKLRAELQIARGRQPREPAADFQRLVELQARRVGLLVHADVGVAHHVVEQMLEPLAAEHGRIHLHDHVHVELGEQEFANPLDLAGRAAVERGKRDAAAQIGGIIELAQRAEPARNLVAQSIDAFAGIDHAADEVHDLRRLDAGQVVADRHVVDRFAAGAVHRRRRRTGGQKRPGAFRSMWISIAPATYCSSESATRSSCDHSTL